MWVGVHAGTSYTNFLFLATTKTNLDCDMNLSYYERELVVNLLLISNDLGLFFAQAVATFIMLYRYPELLFNPPGWLAFNNNNYISFKVIVVFTWLLSLLTRPLWDWSHWNSFKRYRLNLKCWSMLSSGGLIWFGVDFLKSLFLGACCSGWHCLLDLLFQTDTPHWKFLGIVETSYWIAVCYFYLHFRKRFVVRLNQLRIRRQHWSLLLSFIFCLSLQIFDQLFLFLNFRHQLIGPRIELFLEPFFNSFDNLLL